MEFSDVICRRRSVRDYQKQEIPLSIVKDILKLDKLSRIEIFDNAHLFGTYNVSGMVVFINTGTFNHARSVLYSL